MFHLSSQKIFLLHHARYLQAFDPCATTNPCTTLLITGCGPSFGVNERVWGLSSGFQAKNDAHPYRDNYVTFIEKHESEE